MSSDAQPQNTADEAKASGEAKVDATVEELAKALEQVNVEDQESSVGGLKSLSIEGVAEYIKSGRAKNIVVMTGAGISVSAGIPDFRSPKTGLYANLKKYNLPYPEAIFTLTYFKENPMPFTLLAKEMYPGNFKPTPTHYFIKLLENKNILLRNYTQNIDTLERVAGISGEKIIEAHGSFATNHCISCRQEYDQEFVKEKYFKEETPKCPKCEGLIKPDIVFFGESLPVTFFKKQKLDFLVCDLLIVMGTSLKVYPFAGLIHAPTETCPRVLVNREVVGDADFDEDSGTYSEYGFRFDDPKNKRDVAILDDCDSAVWKLVELIGWKEDLEKLIETSHAAL
eukprot:TRINITY_DN3657_c0_g3_i2.p1 TRINITY_DN3657_c0_g3~~TRINITY_DN3657_c0_g3_i2.p1  ORF type:complete len:340 (-),score=86.11 TRINITY_DN3657_c0_g3_i2:475-1494(-)